MTAKTQPADVHEDPENDFSVDDWLPDRQSDSTAKMWRKRLITGTLLLALIGTAIYVALHTLSNGEGARSFFVNDSPGLDEANAWETTGRNGLRITAMNALEDRWTPYFDNSIREWDNGDPDAVTFSTRKIPHEAECTPENFRIKVCNGDYGNTDWLGIMIAATRDGFIVNSVAKLNDFHLDSESEAQKKYIMCHEIGHALGLPHTDENFYNRDRGDCLDYTTRPQNNLRPGRFNYELLEKIYGPVGGSSAAANSPLPPASGGGKDKKKKDDRKRRLGAPVDHGEIPVDISEKYKSVVAAIGTTSCQNLVDGSDGESLALLHENSQGEACSFDLGDGFSVEVHKLLVE